MERSEAILLARLQEHLPVFKQTLQSPDGRWNARGIVDLKKRLYPLPDDTKLVSKVIEIMLTPALQEFASRFGYRLEFAQHQFTRVSANQRVRRRAMRGNSIGKVRVPPIKCQGIKTKLVPFIARSIRWQGEGRWIEPFLGSGVVAFNLKPRRALLADINPHIIRFYQAIQRNEITPQAVREYLTEEGEQLARKGEAHYYAIRERFNREQNPLDFLFLNRAGFNGLVRFNRQGELNVPFCRKPERFSPAYISKIVNQVRWVYQLLQTHDWEFRAASWEQTLTEAMPSDFAYLDPPYEGRHTDYYNQWNTEDTHHLLETLKQLRCGYALSMWLENPYRQNMVAHYLKQSHAVRTYEHFYHIGAEEKNRHWMREALIIHPDFAQVGNRLVSPPAGHAVQRSLF
jgi:DNA adenine methylase